MKLSTNESRASTFLDIEVDPSVPDDEPVEAALEDPGLGEGDAVSARGEGQDPVLGEARHDPVALAGVEIPLDGVYVFPRGDCVEACQYHLRARLDNI